MEDKAKHASAIKDANIVLFGAKGVGKTALTVRYITKRFIGDYDPDMEAIYSHICLVDGKQFNLQIMDTGWQTETSDIKEDQLQWADAFLIVFSLTDRFSFDIAQGFLTYVCSNREDVRTPVIFLGNKCDLIHRRTISEKEASHVADSHSCQYLETSASENYAGVVHAFAELCRQIKVVNKKKEKLKKLMQKPSVAKKLQIRQSLRNFAERTWRSRTSTV
ncbi:hypothetical protein ScPMuIL_012430 [Solemya velum]